ncbi:MAG TPA: acyltransferase [Chitinophagaceae bacterium]|jgi:peptidoglycan/LPS O-acetylase OafA/YrhL
MRPIPYFKGLDVARFFAATLVVLAHAHFQLMQLHITWHDNLAIMRQGGIAVVFFFTLSGFLLTCLGIQEYTRNGSLNSRKFYSRRILRIWPLYYFTVLLCFFTGLVLLPVFYSSFAAHIPMPVSLLCTLFFIPNYLNANHLTNFGAINGLWSIGVEELFYVFFPLLFRLYKRVKSFWLIFLAALVTYLLLYRSLHYTKIFLPLAIVRFLGTYVFHYMLAGAVVGALWMKYRERPKALRWFNGIAGLLGAGIVFTLAADINIDVGRTGLLYPLLFAVLILFIAQLPNGLFNNNPLVYFGKISYGIYLLHPFVSYFLRALYAGSGLFAKAVNAMPSLYFILLLVLTIGVAHLSYRWLERRFLKWKEKLVAA